MATPLRPLNDNCPESASIRIAYQAKCTELREVKASKESLQKSYAELLQKYYDPKRQEHRTSTPVPSIVLDNNKSAARKIELLEKQVKALKTENERYAKELIQANKTIEALHHHLPVQLKPPPPQPPAPRQHHHHHGIFTSTTVSILSPIVPTFTSPPDGAAAPFARLQESIDNEEEEGNDKENDENSDALDSKLENMDHETATTTTTTDDDESSSSSSAVESLHFHETRIATLERQPSFWTTIAPDENEMFLLVRLKSSARGSGAGTQHDGASAAPAAKRGRGRGGSRGRGGAVGRGRHTTRASVEHGPILLDFNVPIYSYFIAKVFAFQRNANGKGRHLYRVRYYKKSYSTVNKQLIFTPYENEPDYYVESEHAFQIPCKPTYLRGAQLTFPTFSFLKFKMG